MHFLVFSNHKVDFSFICCFPQVEKAGMIQLSSWQWCIVDSIAGDAQQREVITLHKAISTLTRKHASFQSVKCIGEVRLRALCMDKTQMTALEREVFWRSANWPDNATLMRSLHSSNPAGRAPLGTWIFSP